MEQMIKIFFHKIADEGKAITRIRQEYAQNGKYLTAFRAACIIKLNSIRKDFNKPITKPKNLKLQMWKNRT